MRAPSTALYRRKFVINRVHNFVAIAALFHIDKVHDDNAAKVAQPDLPHDFFHGFQIRFDDRIFNRVEPFRRISLY